MYAPLILDREQVGTRVGASRVNTSQILYIEFSLINSVHRFPFFQCGSRESGLRVVTPLEWGIFSLSHRKEPK